MQNLLSSNTNLCSPLSDIYRIPPRSTRSHPITCGHRQRHIACEETSHVRHRDADTLARTTTLRNRAHSPVFCESIYGCKHICTVECARFCTYAGPPGDPHRVPSVELISAANLLRHPAFPPCPGGASPPASRPSRRHLPGPGGRAIPRHDRSEQSLPHRPAGNSCRWGRIFRARRRVFSTNDSAARRELPELRRHFFGRITPAIRCQAGVRAASSDSLGAPEPSARSGTARS